MINWRVYVVLVVLVLFFLILIFVYFKRAWMKGFRAEESKYIQSHWIRIIDSFSSNPKNAILDADKLLDYALSKKGFSGTLGEKLKNAGARFSDLNGVWSAHKLRNHIAHELGDIDISYAKSALYQFKRALNDLGAGL